MSKAEWGVKRLCPGCGALYYDMKKNPPVCPKCSTTFDPEALLKSRRRITADESKKKVADPVEEVEDIEVEDDAEAVVADPAIEEDDDGEAVEIDVNTEDDK